MSNKENVTEEKVMTKYDLKQQKRKEAEAKKKKEKRNEKIIWTVVIVAVLCFIASFPIRSYMAQNSAYIRIGGRDITKVEFDYNYNIVKNNFMNEYGSYLSFLGIDSTADLSKQMYAEDMSWQDYFEQQAVNGMVQGKALMIEAEAEGFTYDVEEDYKAYVEGIEAAAEAAGISAKDYIKQAYGRYATMDRIEEYIQESLMVNAFYAQKNDELLPSDDEVQAYYEANKKNFESVDYYLTTINAEVSSEATDDEVTKAMEDAKVSADAAEANVTSEGTLSENVTYDTAVAAIRDWLFDDARKEGDTTIAEDTTGHRYYVVSFVRRYLNENPTVDARVIVTAQDNGQAILDEWKSGEATAESFSELAATYNDTTLAPAADGNYAAITESNIDATVAGWLFDGSRAEGDTTALVGTDGYTYVVYYVGTNEPEWKIDASAELLSANMDTYIQEITESVVVEDLKAGLKYLEVQAEAEAAN